ncbi:hypothetical protein, partial [Escherichia coli]|uniref:hypothetical protein n=1 Tax=Escherichia coli TaxID=562 RepID=UPI001D06356F
PWLQMTNMISYQGLVRTFPKAKKSGAEWNRLMRYAYQAYVILQFIEFARTCRPDKAFTPHPA